MGWPVSEDRGDKVSGWCGGCVEMYLRVSAVQMRRYYNTTYIYYDYHQHHLYIYWVIINTAYIY